MFPLQNLARKGLTTKWEPFYMYAITVTRSTGFVLNNMIFKDSMNNMGQQELMFLQVMGCEAERTGHIIQPNIKIPAGMWQWVNEEPSSANI